MSTTISTTSATILVHDFVDDDVHHLSDDFGARLEKRSHTPGNRRCICTQRAKALDGLEDWLGERFRRHRGNADVVRQDLVREKGIVVSLRTIERAVAPLRQAIKAEARATIRFETPLGRQLQIDFGETRVAIGGENVRLHLFGAAGLLAALFRCAETTAATREVAEMALGHSIGNRTEETYRRGDLLAKRRELMEAWGDYLAEV